MAAASQRAALHPPPHRAGGRFLRGMTARFAAALALSTLFHLSMVTLFQIVVYFPREDTEYLQFEIVSVAPARRAAAPPPGNDPAFADISGGLRLGGSELARSIAPEVDLPSLEFAELDRLRVRSEAGGPGDIVDRMFADRAPADSWGRFSREMRQFGQSLRQFAAPDDPGAPAAPEKIPAARHRPATGYGGYVLWDGEPAARELLFAPPVQALWNTDPGAAKWPVEMVITVNPSGRVINAWISNAGEGPLLDAIQMAVLQYRFAPLPGADGGGANQMGTLFIAPAEGGQ